MKRTRFCFYLLPAIKFHLFFTCWIFFVFCIAISIESKARLCRRRRRRVHIHNGCVAVDVTLCLHYARCRRLFNGSIPIDFAVPIHIYSVFCFSNEKYVLSLCCEERLLLLRVHVSKAVESNAMSFNSNFAARSTYCGFENCLIWFYMHDSYSGLF